MLSLTVRRLGGAMRVPFSFELANVYVVPSVTLDYHETTGIPAETRRTGGRSTPVRYFRRLTRGFSGPRVRHDAPGTHGRVA